MLDHASGTSARSGNELDIESLHRGLGLIKVCSAWFFRSLTPAYCRKPLALQIGSFLRFCRQANLCISWQRDILLFL